MIVSQPVHSLVVDIAIPKNEGQKEEAHHTKSLTQLKQNKTLAQPLPPQLYWRNLETKDPFRQSYSLNNKHN